MPGRADEKEPRAASWLGRLVAQRYRLIGRLGEGSMAEVYLARHVLIDRLSAIKVLRPEYGGDIHLRRRFLQEAKAVNRINHPNIVEITDYGETDATAYLVMEYVPGEALARRLRPGAPGAEPLGFKAALQMGLQIASALSRAHEMGVVHRDLTPANVLLVPRRFAGDLVKLTDFGVAKMLHATRSTAFTAGAADGRFDPHYSAPEVAALGTVDPRSDLYSLGVVLFEATSGQLPYPRGRELTAPDARGGPQSIRPPLRLVDVAPDVPPLFDEILATLLAPDPDDRPRDAFETFEMLRRVAEETDAPVSRASIASVTKPSDPRPRRAGPHLLTVSFERIGPICAQAWTAIGDALAARKDEQHPQVEATERLVRMVEGLARIVESDARALSEVEQRGRRFRAEYGARLDHFAKQKSQSIGWAGTIAERRDFVRKERHSGAHPITASDAMLWEQAALEQEEERAYAVVEALTAEFDALQRQLEKLNEDLDHETDVLTAQLDGHIAALRSLAVEAWMALDQLATTLGIDLDAVVSEPASMRPLLTDLAARKPS
ncbi:MAG: protein kinase [Polyangiaceae bacterium]